MNETKSLDSTLDSLANEPLDVPKRKGRPRKNVDVSTDIDAGTPERRPRKSKAAPVEISADQCALVTTGLLIALEGITKLPFKTTDADLKTNLDQSLAIVANQYGGEALQKYAPIAQLAVVASLITLDAMKRKREVQRDLFAQGLTEVKPE